jgi:hypothetical protein
MNDGRTYLSLLVGSLARERRDGVRRSHLEKHFKHVKKANRIAEDEHLVTVLVPEHQQLLKNAPFATELRVRVVDDVLTIAVKILPRVRRSHFQHVEFSLVLLASIRADWKQQRQVIGDLLEYMESWEDKMLPLGPVDVCVAAPTLFPPRVTRAWFMSISNALHHLGVAEVVVCELLRLAQWAEHHLVALLG